MTVREVIKVLRNVERISIGFGDRAIRIDQDDALMIGVYGDYVVDTIHPDAAGEVEIGVAMIPVKEVANAH